MQPDSDAAGAKRDGGTGRDGAFFENPPYRASCVNRMIAW